MSITVVLAIGLNQELLDAQRIALRSGGYFVSTASSMGAAMEQLQEGDYDLVLMGQSIPAESRERLTMMIRATGLRVPVMCLAESPNYLDAFKSLVAETGARGVLRNIADAVANQRKPVARAALRDSERLRRLAG
ncbi:MAG: response regulator [Acidobacteriota bacterium]|nr:response regulator [Acidobacteriota bacterium]